MRLTELKQAMDFVKKNVVDAQIPNRFQELVLVLQHNAQMRPNQQPQPITEQKSKLISGIEDMDLEALTLNERTILSQYISLDLMGPEGVAGINTIFAEHNLDPMGAIQAFDAIKQRYDKLIGAAVNTLAILKPLNLESLEVDIPEGYAVVQIGFKERASIVTVVDWRESSDHWFHILRAFCMLAETAPDQTKVLSFQKGSVIVEVLTIYVVAQALGLATDRILGVIGRVLEIRKKIAEIKNLDLTNKQIENDLKKEADTYQENKENQIAEQVIGDINKAKLADGETVNAVRIAVKHLFEFLDRGGTIDCRLRLSEDNAKAKQLKGLFDGIRKLETRIDELKLIRHDTEVAE